MTKWSDSSNLDRTIRFPFAVALTWREVLALRPFMRGLFLLGSLLYPGVMTIVGIAIGRNSLRGITNTSEDMVIGAIGLVISGLSLWFAIRGLSVACQFLYYLYANPFSRGKS